LLVKITVLVLSIWFLYAKLIAGDGWQVFASRTQAIIEEVNLYSLWPMLALMIVNWGIEAQKWKILISRFEKISYKTAFKAVFTGVFISLFVNILVPNRVGEFAGRILYVERLHKVKAALVASIGSFAQFTVTVLAGSVAYLFFWQLYQYDEWHIYTQYLLVVAMVFFALLVPLLYFNINVFSWILSKPRWLRRFKKITSVFYFYDNTRLLKVLGLSALRYFVFAWQFILLLWICDVNISVEDGWVIIPVIFLVQTVVPSNALSDLGLRGLASEHFLGYFSAN